MEYYFNDSEQMHREVGELTQKENQHKMILQYDDLFRVGSFYLNCQTMVASQWNNSCFLLKNGMKRKSPSSHMAWAILRRMLIELAIKVNKCNEKS